MRWAARWAGPRPPAAARRRVGVPVRVPDRPTGAVDTCGAVRWNGTRHAVWPRGRASPTGHRTGPGAPAARAREPPRTLLSWFLQRLYIVNAWLCGCVAPRAPATAASDAIDRVFGVDPNPCGRGLYPLNAGAHRQGPTVVCARHVAGSSDICRLGSKTRACCPRPARRHDLPHS